MKKLILAAATICFVAAGAFAQVGGLLKKAKEKVQNKVEDKAGTAKQTQPAPSDQPSQNNAANVNNSEAAADATMTYAPMPTVAAEKLTSLPANFFLVYEESSLLMSSTSNSIVLVAGSKDKSYQIFRNGQWSEPIKNLDRKTAMQYGVSVNMTSNRNLYRFASKITPNGEGNSLIQRRKMMMNGVPIGEEQVIVHNGKTYGPYVMIQEAALSSDGKHFFAIVMPKYNDDYSKLWQEYRLIGDQLPNPLQIIPNDRKATNLSFGLLASGDGTNAVITISDFSDYQNVTQELLCNDGRRFHVEKLKEGGLLLDDNNSFFSLDGKSFCTLENGNNLYVNGKLVKTFTEHQHLSNAMFNEKGEELFKISRRGIAFTDGTVVPIAMRINTFMENGKMTVGWLAPYKDGSIYLCKKTL